MKVREMVCRHEYERKKTVCSVDGDVTEIMGKCSKCGKVIHIRVGNEIIFRAMEKIIEGQTS